MISEATNLCVLIIFGSANAAACVFTIITTNQFLKRPGFYEANPVARWLQRVLPRETWWVPKAAFYLAVIALCAFLPSPAGIILVPLFMVTAFDLIGNLSLLSGE